MNTPNYANPPSYNITAAQTSSAVITVSGDIQGSSSVILGKKDRLGALFFNSSNQPAFLTLAETSNPKTCSFKIAGGESFLLPFAYNGKVSAIRENGSGSIIITEFITSPISL